MVKVDDKTGALYKNPLTNKTGMHAEMKKNMDAQLFLKKTFSFILGDNAENNEDADELKQMIILKLDKDANKDSVKQLKSRFAKYFTAGEQEGVMDATFTSNYLVAEIKESEVTEVINQLLSEFTDVITLVENDRQIQSTRSWSLDYMNQEYENNAHEDGNFNFEGTGEGVDIFILDTAIRTDDEVFSHPENGTTRFYLGSSCISGLCLTQYCSSIKCGRGHTDSFQNNHGSSVGVCAASKNQYGIASRARLNVMEVLDPITGMGSISSVVRALEYIGLLKDYIYDKVVINMSLGLTSPFPESSCSSAFYEAIDDLVNTHNFAVVSAAGNQGDDACNYCLRNSSGLVVGATTRSGVIAGFSNTGECVDIYSPGANVEVPPSFGSLTSGTSYSSPYVAGILAVLMERHDINGKEAMDLLLKLAYNNNSENSSPVEIDENILEAYLPPFANSVNINDLYSPPDSLFTGSSKNNGSRLSSCQGLMSTIMLLILKILLI